MDNIVHGGCSILKRLFLFFTRRVGTWGWFRSVRSTGGEKGSHTDIDIAFFDNHHLTIDLINDTVDFFPG